MTADQFYDSFTAYPRVVGFINKYVGVRVADCVLLHSRLLRQRFLYVLMIRFTWIIECTIASECTLEYPLKTESRSVHIRNVPESFVTFSIRALSIFVVKLQIIAREREGEIACLFFHAGSTADNADLETADEILEVNGRTLGDATHNEVIQYIHEVIHYSFSSSVDEIESSNKLNREISM